MRSVPGRGTAVPGKRPGVATRPGTVLSSLFLLAGLTACVTDQNAAPPPVPATPTLVSEQLIGLDATLLVQTLGTPRSLRRERPAEIWQYRNEACVLDVFLYDAPPGLQVVHLEARDANATPVTPQSCLSTLTPTTPT